MADHLIFIRIRKQEQVSNTFRITDPWRVRKPIVRLRQKQYEERGLMPNVYIGRLSDFVELEEYADMMEDMEAYRFRGTSKEIEAQIRLIKSSASTRFLHVHRDKYPYLGGYHGFKDALTLFWRRKAPGWKAYKNLYDFYRVCDQKQLTAALKAAT